MFGVFSDYFENDFQFKEGLNVDETFDEKNFDDKLDKRSMIFYSIETVVCFINNIEGEFRNRLAFISIPKTSKVVYFNEIIRADKVIVTKIIDLEDWEMWNDEKFCFEAVKQNGYALLFVKNQTKEICLEAIDQHGMFLEFVRNPTEEMCLEAVKNNGEALQFVKNQTEAICLQAIKNYRDAFHFVENKTKSIRELYDLKKRF